jgi:hypothetical protein
MGHQKSCTGKNDSKIDEHEYLLLSCFKMKTRSVSLQFLATLAEGSD